MSTACKVATVFFSVLFFPIAIVSIASLTIKLATFPWMWEEKKVKVQSQETWNAINQFNNAFQKNEYDKAIQVFSQRCEIGRRSDVYGDLFKVINWKINNHSPWEEVQTALPFLRANDAIELINHAIKTKLSYEFINDCNLTSASHIINFIQNSLKNSNIQILETCYKKLFSDALQIDVAENIVASAIKMDIADHMIRSFTQIKKSHAKNELERVTADLEENLLRSSLFKKEQHYANLYLIFISIDSMQQVSAIIQNIRNVNQVGWQSLNKLNALSTEHNKNEPEQWKDIRSEFIKFKGNLDQLSISADEGEKVYIKSLQIVFDHMIGFIDSIWRASTAEEIESFTRNMETSLAEQTNNFSNLFADTKISYSQTNLDNLSSTLRLKKKADLFTFTEKMKSFLMTTMVQRANAILQKAS